MEEKNAGSRAMHRIAAWIVDKRNLFFLLYVFALVFCVFSRNWVQVENDVTAYLPQDTETRQSLMNPREAERQPFRRGSGKGRRVYPLLATSPAVSLLGL